MSTSQVSLFLAILALGAAAAGAAALTVVVARRSESLAPLEPLLMPGAAIVAITSTAGSLYYSEIADFVPCEWCWYQRILMYPLVMVIPLAIIRRDRGGAAYALALAVVGLAASVYHYQLQVFPEQGSSCDIDAPCTLRLVEELGFVSIPFMAGSGFLAIVGLSALSLRLSGSAPHPAGPEPAPHLEPEREA